MEINNLEEEIPSKTTQNKNINDNNNINTYTQTNNIDFILMEKDKEIINLSHKIKSLNSNIDIL